MSGEPSPTMDEIDLARSREYSLLSVLLLRSPDAHMLGRLAALVGDASPIGTAHAAVAQAARRLDAEQVGREYFNLFVGVGRGELLPYASFYLTGSLNGRPLAVLRQTLQRLGIERVAGLTEPEDHAGILCEVMAALTGGSIAAPAHASQDFFVEHLAPWMPRLFHDVERAGFADFYASVGALGRRFMEIEIESLTLPA
jgi:TorA maturation chaperone TorD